MRVRPASDARESARNDFKTRPADLRDMNADAAPQEITTLVGREVYSNNGVFVGEVEDIRLDVDSQAVTGLALSQLSDELFASRIEPGKGVMIPYRWVRAVGDVVLINDTIERLKDETNEEAVA